jgi:hypothetical protein
MYLCHACMNKARKKYISVQGFPTVPSLFFFNFSSVHWIFNKLGHMIPLCKGKNPIYFGVIRSKVKVTVTMIVLSRTEKGQGNFFLKGTLHVEFTKKGT